MLVKIKRQKDGDSAPYWQRFSCETTPDMTVAAVLDRLNYTDDLFDAEGASAPRIRWECSCLQKMCGGCAMVINGTPALACSTFLRDLEGDSLTLEPLTKFPVVADLVVDRGIIEENLRRAEAFLGTFGGAEEKAYPQLYAISKCLRCGLCLEVCPNYVRGEDFFGALFANESYLLYTQSGDRKKETAREYDRHFARGCSKALSCQQICPMGISTLTSMARMNFHGKKKN